MHAAAGRRVCERGSGSDSTSAGADDAPGSPVLGLSAPMARMGVGEAEAALLTAASPTGADGVADETSMSAGAGEYAATEPAAIIDLPPLPGASTGGAGRHAATTFAQTAAADMRALPEASLGGDSGDAAETPAEAAAVVHLPPLLPELWGAIARCDGAQHPACIENSVRALSAGLVMIRCSPRLGLSSL